MPVTHGGRRKTFRWTVVGETIQITNEDGRQHVYRFPEVFIIIHWLLKRFGSGWFPLANNVETMYRGEEKDGLGVAILELTSGDISHAQGASYLGVVLEEVGIFVWNGARRGIEWQIIKVPKSMDQLKRMLITRVG